MSAVVPAGVRVSFHFLRAVIMAACAAVAAVNDIAIPVIGWLDMLSACFDIVAAMPMRTAAVIAR